MKFWGLQKSLHLQNQWLEINTNLGTQGIKVFHHRINKEKNSKQAKRQFRSGTQPSNLLLTIQGKTGLFSYEINFLNEVMTDQVAEISS